MAILLRFNSNMGCIEILSLLGSNTAKEMFNSNMGCIEILLLHHQ